MDAQHRLWDIERTLWLDGVSAYRERMDEACLMAFPGMGVMRALCVEAIEEPDGSKSFTDDSWKDEPLSAMKALYYAVCKVHGVDLAAMKPAAELTEEEIEGNVEPSKTSGANSQSSAAAPSQS